MLTASLSPIFAHLWQSTLFGGGAALLACALKNNRAHVRYCVWLIASLKFFVPLSLLIALGSHVSWSIGAPLAHSTHALVQRIEQPLSISQLFPSVSQSASATSEKLYPAILLALWLCGFVAVLFIWSSRWLQIRAVVTAAMPLSLDTPIPALTSPTILEPGVFGLFRPVLLLPAGITDYLTPAHLGAILAHETCHVHRRDNLMAALHMLVEAVFWFHPLVWYIGSRLIEERERACDEEVLRLGNQPGVYAESILKVCQLYLESPLPCLSGVTGSDLKNRMARIMREGVRSQLDFRTKLLLTFAAIAVVAAPVAMGVDHNLQSQALDPDPSKPRLKFEVASVKPSGPAMDGMSINNGSGGRYVAHGLTVKMLIVNAFDLHEFQISGGPDWMNSARYDIEAKADEDGAASLPARGKATHQRLQSLLIERFNFKFHTGTKELPIYALVVGKAGSKLKPPVNAGTESMTMSDGKLTADSISMYMFAANLSNILQRIVQDKTGLAGSFNLTLQWTPEQEKPASDATAPSIFTAVQEQLGLKLESQKGPVQTLIVDHVDRPSEN